MERCKDLLWCLAKLCDLYLEGCALNWIRKLVEIDTALIGHWMEHIVRIYAALIDSKDKIDPVV